MKRANKDGKLNGMFDIHIAVPKMGWERLIAVQLSLHPIIPKFKYFVEVKNFGYDAHYPWTRETSAKDHDLEEPGAMATVKVGNGRREETYTAAQQKIRQAMTILEEHGIKDGNFELEHFLDERLSDFDDFDMKKDFHGYEQILPPGAPSHENHVIYRRKFGELPSMDEIKTTYNRVLGVTPHQAVVFGYRQHPSLEEQASLALTFYQADRRSVLECGQRLEKAQDRLRCDDVITEQVCIVGERKG
ncbi:MAG TPA: hypothetical protein VJK72_03135 [Candidatus Nanoarchaeia archaeon]|nr:hypothetical protein [Candidatus Nanoarchaeia archaeon]